MGGGWRVGGATFRQEHHRKRTVVHLLLNWQTWYKGHGHRLDIGKMYKQKTEPYLEIFYVLYRSQLIRFSFLFAVFTELGRREHIVFRPYLQTDICIV